MTEATAPKVCLSSVDGRLLALFEAAQRWIHDQGLILAEIECVLCLAASFSTCTAAALRLRGSPHPSGLPTN
jgi:hypothetical protein